MKEETRESIDNCLRTFAMIVLYKRAIEDSDIDSCMKMIENALAPQE